MSIFKIKNEKWLWLLTGILIFISLSLLSGYQNVPVTALADGKKIVVIDAGHGGGDSGAIGGRVLEKNINLKIAKKVQSYLEQDGYEVIMTRTTDKALARDKQGDMWRRKEITNNSGADIFVSIHQNSTSNCSCKGAQVYFFGKSPKSKLLAKCIQDQIVKNANPSTKFKKPLPNADYYVLRQTKMPSALVECGFLSNSGERWRLTTEDYQDTMAKAIYLGIADYFEEEAKLPQEETDSNQTTAAEPVTEPADTTNLNDIIFYDTAR